MRLRCEFLYAAICTHDDSQLNPISPHAAGPSKGFWLADAAQSLAFATELLINWCRNSLELLRRCIHYDLGIPSNGGSLMWSLSALLIPSFWYAL